VNGASLNGSPVEKRQNASALLDLVAVWPVPTRYRENEV